MLRIGLVSVNDCDGEKNNCLRVNQFFDLTPLIKEFQKMFMEILALKMTKSISSTKNYLSLAKSIYATYASACNFQRCASKVT